jgi:DNA polymerase-3 subunit gamma/tau
MDYLVSARKYRPASFDTVIGQRSITTTLRNAIANRQLAHAYLFCGPRGVGKTTCARIFAKTINCMNPGANAEPCDACESCRAFNDGRSLNIHELDAASNNSVDDIRGLVEQVRVLPQVGKYSVYIVDEVHMLSTQAFNAFLKTLEEPPAHAIFILATTEKHKILPTILSRCQIYDFNRIKIADTVEHLKYIASKEGVVAEEEALDVIAQKADGAMRDALSIFDQVVSFCGNELTYARVIEDLNVLDYDYYFRLTDYFYAGKVGECLVLFNEIMEHGFDAGHLLSGLGKHFRDLLVAKEPVTVQLLEVSASIKERYLQQAQTLDVAFIFDALLTIEQGEGQYKVHLDKRFSAELTLIKLAQLVEAKKKSLA